MLDDRPIKVGGSLTGAGNWRYFVERIGCFDLKFRIRQGAALVGGTGRLLDAGGAVRTCPALLDPVAAGADHWSADCRGHCFGILSRRHLVIAIASWWLTLPA